MTPLPMLRSLRLPADPAQPEAAAATLVILLPGAYNRAQDFIAAGFAETASAAPHRFDLVLPEIDLPQLSSGAALPLLHEQLILPARAAGVSRIWLGGASLGGFNSLCYAEHYAGTPGAVDGLCLLAPWPGSRITRKLIDAAGGLERWTPSPEDLATDAELRVWHWLREQRRARVQLPTFIGWGSEDRFAGGIAAYVETMPNAHVEVVPGGHEWAPWAELWRRFCASGAL